jgi:putative ABC transport system permease protein
MAMDTLLQDIRYAFRSLRGSKTVSIVIAGTIAIGICATTTIFSVVNALLLRAPAGINQSGRLVTVHAIAEDGSSFHSFSYLDYRDLAEAKSGLVDLAAFSGAPVSLATGAEPELELAMSVSGNYFRTLRLQPALGRFFSPEEDAGPGSPRVVVLSHDEWTRRFGGDSGVIGRPVILNGEPFTVVGIAPPRFRGHVAAMDARLWIPLSLDSIISRGQNRLDSRQNSWLEMIGRLDQRTSRAAVAAALSTVATRIGRENGAQWDHKVDVRTYWPLPGAAAGPAIGFMGFLLLLGALVLLIASANVANVLIARASARGRDIAVRLALGAGRARLIRQLVLESIALFLLGGVGGTLLASWATRALSRFHPPVDIPIQLDFSMDLRVLLVALGVALATGIGFGLVPALQSTRPDLVRSLKDEPSVVRIGRFRLRGAFVATQVAGTALLLVTAGLLVRALGRAGAIDIGFDPERVYTLSLQMQVRSADLAEIRSFSEQLEAQASVLPGVQAIGTTDLLPLNLSNQQTVVAIPGREERPDVGWFQTDFTSVTPGYFATMKIPLLLGRGFSNQDRQGAPAVAIINETLARRIWPGEDPVGKTLYFGSVRDGTPLTVVGLARTAKYRSLGEDPLPMIYLPFAQQGARALALVVRMAPGTASPSRGLREVVRGLDPALPIAQFASLPEVIGVALLPNRIASGLAALFGGTGMLLAAVGLYGVLSFMVTRRRREIGIRMALGAASRHVRNLVLRDGFRMLALGLGLGLVGAALVARLLGNFLFGLSPLDLLTYGTTTALFTLVGLVACFLPTRRALKTEPVEVLRHD